MSEVRHPAKYTDNILEAIRPWIIGYPKVLDPFAGTGKLRSICPEAYLLEIEPEWAELSGADVGSVLSMRWQDEFFDAIVTSPCYGNRMADHHNAKDGSKRITYTHTLGRPLHPENAGLLQWGEKYKQFHMAAWTECDRVLRPGGRFILNISNHIRDGKEQHVAEWHHLWFAVHNYQTREILEIKTPRMRRGQNGQQRVDTERIYILEKLTWKPLS